MINIETKGLQLLNILTSNNHEAYIVGGYVRDKLLGLQSNDIDICTSATPKEIIALFPSASSPCYGSVHITYKNAHFDITTFRKEIKYQNNRLPVEIEYVKDVITDLKRRDFTINTLCMDKDGNIIDYLNIMPDLKAHQVKTVGNPKITIKEDSLRILRAIRLATTLDFEIDESTKKYIQKYAYLLKKLSPNRRREELDKIFVSRNKEKGINLLTSLKLQTPLELSNLNTITPCDDLIGIWAQLNVDNIYPFTKLEKRQMSKIRNLLNLSLQNPYNIYQYGLYISTVAYQIKGLSILKLNKLYTSLPIHSPKDIDITMSEIATFLNKKPGSYLKQIQSDLEKQIINKTLPNQKESLKNYLAKTYKNL